MYSFCVYVQFLCLCTFFMLTYSVCVYVQCSIYVQFFAIPGIQLKVEINSGVLCCVLAVCYVWSMTWTTFTWPAPSLLRLHPLTTTPTHPPFPWQSLPRLHPFTMARRPPAVWRWTTGTVARGASLMAFWDVCDRCGPLLARPHRLSWSSKVDLLIVMYMSMVTVAEGDSGLVKSRLTLTVSSDAFG